MAEVAREDAEAPLRTTSVVHRAIAAGAILLYLSVVVTAIGTLSVASRAPLDRAPWEAAGWWAAALAATVLLSWVFQRRFYRDLLRQRRVATAVRVVAQERGWVMLERDAELEQGWASAPFSEVRRLGAIPASRGRASGMTAGVACLVGDLPVAGASIRAFMSRIAWVELPEGVPSLTIVRQGFSESLMVALGGRDVDVESHAFNRAWRVLADDECGAHAVLQPVMIALLNSVAEERIALSVNGTRAIVWDDGSDPTVDLKRRLDLVESFVAAIPAYLRGGA